MFLSSEKLILFYNKAQLVSTKELTELENYLRKQNSNTADDFRESFFGSRSALLKWAPVVEEFKIQDEEIVSNSINFKWLRVCQEFEELMDFEKIWLGSDPDNTFLEKKISEIS